MGSYLWMKTVNLRGDTGEHGLYPGSYEFLKERGLELSEEKTHITHIDGGFDFFGMELPQIRRKASDKAIQEIDWEYHP